jgi:hypothetical protein
VSSRCGFSKEGQARKLSPLAVAHVPAQGPRRLRARCGRRRGSRREDATREIGGGEPVRLIDDRWASERRSVPDHRRFDAGAVHPTIALGPVAIAARMRAPSTRTGRKPSSGGEMADVDIAGVLARGCRFEAPLSRGATPMTPQNGSKGMRMSGRKTHSAPVRGWMSSGSSSASASSVGSALI